MLIEEKAEEQSHNGEKSEDGEKSQENTAEIVQKDDQNVTDWCTFEDYEKCFDLNVDSSEEKVPAEQKRAHWDSYVKKLAGETIYEMDKFVARHRQQVVEKKEDDMFTDIVVKRQPSLLSIANRSINLSPRDSIQLTGRTGKVSSDSAFIGAEGFSDNVAEALRQQNTSTHDKDSTESLDR